MDELNRSSNPDAALDTLIASAEEKLQQASQAAATHAFNLAISFGIIPAAVIMLIVFILVKGSLPALFIAGILVVVALVIFASQVVNIARERLLQRLFHESIRPDLIQYQENAGLTSRTFFQMVLDLAPQGSLLLRYLHEDENASSSNEYDAASGIDPE